MYLLLAFLQIFIAAAKALLIPVSNMHRTVWVANATSVEAAQSLSNINLSSWRKSEYPSDFSRDTWSPRGGRSFASASSVPDWY